MDTNRKIATTVGILYIAGTVAGISSVFFTGGLLDGPDFLGKVTAHSTQAQFAALLILTMGIALAFIPVLMFPILKKLSEPLAIGYVIFRGALETLTYIGTAVCWLLLVGVARQYAESGAAASQLPGFGDVLVKAIDPISAIGSIVFSLGALMLYYLLYQANLIPRWISGWGVVAAVLYLAGGLIGVFGSSPVILLLAMLPQEMVMAVWLIVKGFNPSATDSRAASQEKWHPVGT